MTPAPHITEKDLRKMDGCIAELRQAAESLEQAGAGFPAVQRNVKRILASVKMLEINVSEALDL
jgi:hypothetical protein